MGLIHRLRLLRAASRRTRAASGAAWLSVALFGTWRGFFDFVCVYAWFRWADDLIDRPDRHRPEIQSFVQRQRAYIDALCADPADLARSPLDPARSPLDPADASLDPARSPLDPAEKDLSAILSLALRAPASPLLRRSVRGMWSALEADARRDGSPISESLLLAQIRRVGDAYTDALLHACGLPDDHPGAHPAAPIRELARAATGVHHLRDLLEDRSLGYLNLPLPWADLTGIDPVEFTATDALALARWRAPLLLASFARGLDALPDLPWRARWLLGLSAWRYRRLLLRRAAPDV